MSSPEQTTFAVQTKSAATGKVHVLELRRLAVAGTGSFGTVHECEIVSIKGGLHQEPELIAGTKVALKQTKQDRRFKNRELQLMLALHHPNICKLLFYWSEPAPDSRDHVSLSLGLELHSQTIYRAYRSYVKAGHQSLPNFLIKVYMWQIVRAVGYMHALGVCHRDLKPHNIMVDPMTGKAILIDFGSAKVLRPGDTNVSYTCSRFYRAPELIFGATDYTFAIDMWSIGCIFAELFNGSVLFAGTSGIDQLVEIIKVLGTPSKDEICEMNSTYREHRFPEIKAAFLEQILPKCSREAIDLLYSILRYVPRARSTAYEVLSHAFFDELKTTSELRLLNGKRLPPLFNFSREGKSSRRLCLQGAAALTRELAFDQIMADTGIDLASGYEYERLDLSRACADVE
ncbi:glycogen synthase kinase 3 [Microbotryomycetes sp. JL201]|nr:glycogen synthase kinase 3 [Microbotryomycetes sp. JL201]